MINKRVSKWTKSHSEQVFPLESPPRIERQSSMGSGNKAGNNGGSFHRSDHKVFDRSHSARSRLSSDNTTLTGISEYELPLDPAWEFPRDDLMIGPGRFRHSNTIPTKYIFRKLPLPSFLKSRLVGN